MSHGAVVGTLTLAAEPASVPAARRLVRRVLRGHDPELVDSAEICISELVTNAVLHARTEVEVHLEDLGERIRLEVRDSCPTMPRRLVHTVRSATGRGMEMVSLLAGSWGVDLVDERSKSVWCELRVVPPAADGPADDPAALLDAWSDDTDPVFSAWPHDEDPVLTGTRGARRAPSPQSGAASGEVVLLGYPVVLGMRAREHNSAILRECALVQQSRPDTSAPERLVALAEMMTARYAGELAAADEQRLRAYFSGARTIDLRYPALPNARETVEAWREVMAELDTFAAGSALLTLATPPDLLALRHWTVEEFIRQTDGEAPRAWTGPLD